jgi:hypothetical protein
MSDRENADNNQDMLDHSSILSHSDLSGGNPISALAGNQEPIQQVPLAS